MWLNKYEISLNCYYYCLDIKDDPEVRKYITESDIAYFYCIDVKDDPEVRKHIISDLCLRELKRRRNVFI